MIHVNKVTRRKVKLFNIKHVLRSFAYITSGKCSPTSMNCKITYFRQSCTHFSIARMLSKFPGHLNDPMAFNCNHLDTFDEQWQGRYCAQTLECCECSVKYSSFLEEYQSILQWCLNSTSKLSSSSFNTTCIKWNCRTFSLVNASLLT